MLEVCIDSFESAINAIRGGAEELEVCSSLTVGGLTPSAGLVKQITNEVKIPPFDVPDRISPQNNDPEPKRLSKKVKVNVMIRCRTGSDFCYNKEEMDTMLSDIEVLKHFVVDRFVFGGLTDQQNIDEINCSRVIHAAYPIPVTFHRAFDVCKDPITAIDEIIKLGFDRLLTSGQRASANDTKAIELIKTLINSYGNKIEIMPGAGINADNARIFIDMGCKIVHSSCKILRYLPKLKNDLCMGTSDSEYVYITDENIVKKLKDTITM